MRTESDVPDIRVRRCTVRVRRQGGWSWGDPAAYVDPVVVAIEAALRRARDLADLPQGEDLTLDGVVTLEITADGQVTPASLDALIALLRAATTASSGSRAVTGSEPVGESAVDLTTDVAREGVAAADVRALAVALSAWSRSGRLAAVVRSWPAAALDAWMSALLAGADDPATQAAGLRSAAVDAIASAVMGDRPPTTDPRDRLMCGLLLVGAVAAALQDRLPDRATLTMLARHAGVTLDRRHLEPRGPSSAPVQALDRARPAGTASGPTLPPRTAGPVVVPALPFLVLVQLHRIGFLEPASATLVAAGIAPAAESLAAVVAGKVLDPPRYGWLRSPEERLAVELVSGLTSEQIDAAAGQWRERAQAALVPLRTTLVELYVSGRRRYDDVVVTRIDDEVVCGEALGLLPIAWTGTEDDLAAVLAQLGNPPVHDGDVFAPLAQALGLRRALPGPVAPDLERWLGSVAGTALGSLAQELWGRDADAKLALDRLHDLEARVRVGERTTIGVPRGQRWLDLQRAGLLDAWPMPWAPGGVWELVTW